MLFRSVRPEIARVWTRKAAANPRFRFTAKLFHRFTHERDASASEEREVKDGFAPLMGAGKLGALLLQFPWSFKNTLENRQYLAGLFMRFEEYPLVTEVRHGSWNQASGLSFFADHAVGFCNIDQPVIGRSLAPSANVTGPLGYVRLHGRNYETWFAQSGGVGRLIIRPSGVSTSDGTRVGHAGTIALKADPTLLRVTSIGRTVTITTVPAQMTTSLQDIEPYAWTAATIA